MDLLETVPISHEFPAAYTDPWEGHLFQRNVLDPGVDVEVLATLPRGGLWNLLEHLVVGGLRL